MDKLTELEEKIFLFICEYWKENGFSPCIRDIVNNCYVSQSTAYNYILRLYDKGFINYVPNLARSITVKKETNVR